MIDASVIGFISAMTALLASVTAPLVTLYIGRAQIRASVKSANRQKWIDEFRELMAHFCGQLTATTQLWERVVHGGEVRISADSDALIQNYERLIYTATKIRLLIDPSDDGHKRLISLFGEVLSRFKNASSVDELRSSVDDVSKHIVELSLAIIRREWLRVQHGE